MFPGVGDNQVTEYIDYLASFSEGTLTIILTILMYLQKIARPTIAFYGQVDTWTYGNAKHIALLLVGIVAYFGIVVSIHMFKFFYRYARVFALFLYNLFANKSTTSTATYGTGTNNAVDHAGVSVSSSIPTSSAGDVGKDEFDI